MTTAKCHRTRGAGADPLNEKNEMTKKNTIEIAGVQLERDADGSDNFRGAEDDDVSFAWRYPDTAESHVAGKWGCSLYFGPASVGGVAPSLEELDALVRVKIAEARAAFNAWDQS